jgi:putative ABC transport system permease protein
MLTYVLAGIAFISLLVGGIGIMNIMLVSVTERTREIGIRRAVGARQSDVLRQFLVEAVALSMIGGLIGLFISIVITWGVYLAFPKFDMRAPLWILIPAFLISTGIGVAFGVWPARKASRIETIDALRYE